MRIAVTERYIFGHCTMLECMQMRGYKDSAIPRWASVVFDAPHAMTPFKKAGGRSKCYGADVHGASSYLEHEYDKVRTV